MNYKLLFCKKTEFEKFFAKVCLFVWITFVSDQNVFAQSLFFRPISGCIQADPDVRKVVEARVLSLPPPQAPMSWESLVKNRIDEDFTGVDREISGIKVPFAAPPSFNVKAPHFSWSTQGKTLLLCQDQKNYILAFVSTEKVAEFLQGNAQISGSQVMFYGNPPRPVVIVDY